MPNLPFLVAALVAAMCAAAGARQQPPLMQPGAFDIRPLADGVYAILRRDPPGDAANSNVLVIVNERDTIVVDTNLTPSSAEATIAAIRKLTPNPVRYVINTHWHDDHVLGNGVYADAFPGVEFIAHPFTRAQVIETVAAALERNRTAYETQAVATAEQLARGVRADGTPFTDVTRATAERRIRLLRGFLAEIPRIRITPPTLLVEDSLTLRRGEREIIVRFLGRGNTAGDLVVELPRERIVATGDLLVHPIPFSFGSFLGDWIGTLDRVKALNASVIMPGHGDLQRDSTYVDAVQNLLRTVRDQMRDAAARGMTLDQARAALKLDDERRRFTAGDPIRDQEFTAFFVTPASERAYLEATGALK